MSSYRIIVEQQPMYHHVKANLADWIQDVWVPGALESKIRVGVPAYVCTQRERLIAKDEPAPEGLEVLRMYPKTEISVLSGPVCGADFNWWQVKVPGGTEVYFSGLGDERLERDEIVWVREGSDSVDPYYICPLK